MRLVARPRSELWRGVSVWLWAGAGIYVLSIYCLRQLSEATGLNLVPCLIKQVAGQPCPLCGGTRAALLLGHGDALGAFRMNPLVTLSLVAFCLWMALRLAFAKDLEFHPSNRMRLAMVVTALLINWVYVLNRTGGLPN
jgi:Protein of unknown function (DUF2752)